MQNLGNATSKIVAYFMAYNHKSNLDFTVTVPITSIEKHIKKICSTAVLLQLDVVVNDKIISTEVLNKNLDNK